MDLHTDFPERVKPGRKVFVGEKYQPLTLDTVRPHADGLLVSFRGLDTPEDVGKYRNQGIAPEVAARVSGEGELERARAILARKYRDRASTREEIARRMRFLLGRGFSQDTIRKLLPTDLAE